MPTRLPACLPAYLPAYLPACLSVVLCAAGCTAAADAPDTAVEESQCRADLAVGSAESLATGLTDGTEGIAFVDGHLWASSPTGIREIGADGTLGEPTVLDHALGLAPAAGGVLVADPGEFTFDGSGDDGSVRYVSTTTGESAPMGEGMPNPNFVAATPWGDILVSDDTGDTIYAVDSTGAVRPWLEGVPSPNGMAFSPDAGTLYVASTFTPDPPVWRVPVATDGTPGTPAILATLDTGSAPDGLVVDADGGVWVAVNLAGEIARVDPETGDATTVGTGLTNPASLAFGAGDGFDPCSIYYTELYGEAIGRLSTGKTGLTLRPGPAPVR